MMADKDFVLVKVQHPSITLEEVKRLVIEIECDVRQLKQAVQLLELSQVETAVNAQDGTL